MLAGLLDEPLVLAGVEQAVATGAAVQAAAVAGRVDHATVQQPLGSRRRASTAIEPVESGDLRERYAELRDAAR